LEVLIITSNIVKLAAKVGFIRLSAAISLGRRLKMPDFIRFFLTMACVVSKNLRYSRRIHSQKTKKNQNNEN